MAQFAAKSRNSGINLEEFVPVKAGNDGFMADAGKGEAKKLIANSVSDMKDTFLSRNQNCDKKQLLGMIVSWHMRRFFRFTECVYRDR